MSRTAVSDPNDRGPAILQTTWVLTALSIIVTLLRVFVRLRTVQTLYAHDWFMIVAVVCKKKKTFIISYPSKS